MKTKPSYFSSGIRTILSINWAILLVITSGLPKHIVENHIALIPSPKVNVPELTGIPFAPAIFWFGKVDQTNNYADVRVWYYDPHQIRIVLHIIDRRLWYDTTSTISELTQWDAVSLYLNLDGNTGSSPGPDSYLFELQLYSNLQASYRGNGSDWISASIPITATTDYRGANGPNSDADSEGWEAYFIIPFDSLGPQAAPSPGTTWGMGITLHDRDDAGGLVFQETLWPGTMLPDVPSTWGQLSFGLENFIPPRALPTGSVTIRQGLNGATVVDGEVGGHTTCGNDGYNKWTEWGNTNYAGINQINIQNQWDVSDWPCFSKFYITFPITAIPPGSTIISATLTMNLFGTAGGGQWGDPPVSYLNVLTVGSDWDESTLTWNNSPLASENISGTWVPPIVGAYNWDVGRAVTQAYDSGNPVRLVVYSVDSEMHSGKYFYSSDSNDWGGEVRPTLVVAYGNSCNSPSVTCTFSFLPLVVR